jgi:hypothetical protein
MTRSFAPVLAGSLAVVICTSSAQAQVSTKYLDLTLGAGYSSNPFLRNVGADGSFFGRTSARGAYILRGEKSISSLTGFVEASTYSNDYGLKSVFDVNGSHSQQVSEKVTVFGSAGASGDIAGQLSNRFLYVPPTVETPGAIPLLPPTLEDQDLYYFEGRQYRFYGQAGLISRLDERSTLTVTGGGSRNTFAQQGLRDSTTVFASTSYGRILSERTTLGFNLFGARTNFDGSSDYVAALNPSVSVSSRLSENLDATAGVGISLSQFRHGADSDSSVDLSLDGSICRTSESERLCGQVSRHAQSTVAASVIRATSASANWFKKLDARQTVQLSAGYTRLSGTAANPVDQELHSSQLRAAASYSRLLDDRLSLGAEAGARSFRRPGDDPSPDFSGSIFVRYRLGDVR